MVKLDAKNVNNLGVLKVNKIRKAQDVSNRDNCSICLRAKRNKATVLDCKHSFCFDCIKEWAQKKLQCPLCKTNFINVITSKRIYYDLTTPSSTSMNVEEQSAQQLFDCIQKNKIDQESLISDDDKNISIEKCRNHKKQPKFKIVKELIRLDIVMKNVTNQSMNISVQNQTTSTINMQQIQDFSNILTNSSRPSTQLNASQSINNFSQQNNLNQQQIQNELLLEQEKIDKIVPLIQQNTQNNFISSDIQQNLHPDYIIQLIKQTLNTEGNSNQISYQAQLMLRLHLSNTRYNLLGYLYQNLFKTDLNSEATSYDHLQVQESPNPLQIEKIQQQQILNNQIPCQSQSWLQLNNIFTSQLLEQTINQISFTAKFFDIQNTHPAYQSIEQIQQQLPIQQQQQQQQQNQQ